MNWLKSKYTSFELRKYIMHFFVFIFFALVSYFSLAQDSVKSTIIVKHSLPGDKNSYHRYPPNKKRIHLVAAGNIAGYTATLIGFNSAWYAKYPKRNFHFFNDNAEWLQVDKAGHLYGAYIGSRTSNELWRWAGLPRKQRIWISGLSGIAYEGIIETLDGFSSQYGWSWADFSANVLGSALFVTQELVWDEQRIKLKFSYHKKNYKEADLIARANAIYGKTLAEQFTKDYNGMTDWLSIDLRSFLPETKIPHWLAMAFGYGAEGMFGARSNIAVDKNGVIIFDRSDIERYRQWYISPDIDLTKIKTNKKGLRVLFFVLSAFKFPAPSLEFSRGNIKGHWLYF